MYSLNSNTRRITSYVQEESYKWLFNKIIKNGYEVGSNRKAQTLILEIKKAGCVTKDTYNRFLGFVVYNPFTCVLQGVKSRKKKFISTDKIENFFIKMNGVILPIGFVKEFFEDDYETQLDVDKYIESVTTGQEEIFALQCQESLLFKSNKINEMKTEKPYVFKTHFMFHFHNVFKLILTIATLICCINYYTENEIIDLIIGYFKGDPDCQLIVSENWFPILFNTYILITLISRSFNSIKTVIFYVRWLYIRIYVFLVELYIQQFETKKLDALRDYFKSIIPEMAKTHVITEEMCKNVPAAKSQYFAIMNFRCENLVDKITKLYSSRTFAFLNAYYDADNASDLSIKKKRWAKKSIKFALILVVLWFLNVDTLRELATDIYEQIMAYIESV